MQRILRTCVSRYLVLCWVWLAACSGFAGASPSGTLGGAPLAGGSWLSPQAESSPQSGPGGAEPESTPPKSTITQDPTEATGTPPQETDSGEPATEPVQDPASAPNSPPPNDAENPDWSLGANLVIESHPAELVTMGSLNADGTDRFLITFSTRGASIVRVELNARQRNGEYAYRDLEHFGGYLGKLELARTPNGNRIGVVGPGTPAAKAGLQAGDYISKLNDVPVTSPDDFWQQLAETKVRQTIKIDYVRNDQPQSTSVTLTDQPLEMIKHEVDFVEPGVSSPPSFLMQLLKVDAGEWQPLDPGMLQGDWRYEKTSTDEADIIDFHYDLDAEKLEKFGLPGPITVTKRFRLAKLSPELASDLNSRSFHIGFELLVNNRGGGDLKDLGVQINGPTGATTEGWWYQNKIHGRSTAIGYLAGARDVVCSTAYRPYRFEGCPEIVSETTKSNPEIYFIIDRPENQNDNPKKQEVRYLGVDTQYFNIALLPVTAETNTEPVYHCYSALAYVASSKIPKQKKLHRTVDCSFMLFDEISVPSGQTYRQQFEVFAGPKQKQLLAEYGLEDNLTYGWFAMFSKFLCWLLRVFYTVTFQWSYGIAIVLLTVLVRCLMLPISRKAAKNAQMMQLLGPEMKRIADKYKDNMEKRAQAQKELFRRHNYNPAGGCLLMFFQLPIFIGLYRGLSVDIALRDQPLIPGMSWCSNLAAPDQLLYWKDWSWMPAFLGSESGWLGPYFNVLPLVTIVLFLIQQKLFTPPPTDEQQAIAQKMMSYMMIFMGVMFFKVPAGLCIYFITSSIWGIMERKLLPKPQLSEDKVNSIKQAIDAELSVSPTSPSPRNTGVVDATAVRSKTEGGFMGRIKDAIEQAQNKRPAPIDPEQQKQQDRERKRRLKNKGL